MLRLIASRGSDIDPTQPDNSEHRIGFTDPSDYARMRDTLALADFSDEGIRNACGGDTLLTVQEQDLPGLLRKTAQRSPLSTLIRLFVLGVPADVSTARLAAKPMGLEKWVEAGLIMIDGDYATARLRMTSFCGCVLAFDRPMSASRGVREDFVMGVGTSTLSLANVTVRRRVTRALDLGAGCGVHAFLAAPHCDYVAAVDRNPRATALASFNAQLNNLSHVECLTGDLFSPVESQRFDLIVSNPPFVISPSSRYIYRDSGLRGDAFCRRLAQESADYLEEGGFCQFMCNWAHRDGEGWDERLRDWFAPTGCDTWVMRTVTRDASNYATTWINRTEAREYRDYAHIYDQWMSYYEQEEIDEISGGLVTMRKATGRRPWLRTDDAPPKMLGPSGGDIMLCFALRDYLENISDEGLLEEKLHVSPVVQLNQQSGPRDGGWALTKSELTRNQGLAFTGRVDSYTASLIARCTGHQTLRELIQELAAVVHQDFGSLAEQILIFTRQLIDQAILIPHSLATTN